MRSCQFYEPMMHYEGQFQLISMVPENAIGPDGLRKIFCLQNFHRLPQMINGRPHAAEAGLT